MNSPELQWLLNATSAPSIVAEQASSIDGARLTALVISHGLSLQILPFAHALAPDAATSLRRDARRAAMDGLRHRANLSAILSEFRASEIPVVSFKGPVLSDLLYPTGGGRCFNDLDLLVKPEDVNVAVAALRNLSYRPLVAVANPASSPVLRYGGEMLLRSKAARSQIDLHWKLLGWSAPSSRRLDEKQIWKHVEPALWQGQAILTFPATDLAGYLCHHGSKHLWLHLKYLADLTRFFEAHLAVDWDALLDEAVRDGHTRFLLLGPWLAHRLLRAPIPEKWLRRCERDPELKHIAEYVSVALESPEEWRKHIRNRSVWATLLESRWAAARYLWIESLGPSAADWESVQLPEALSFLYYPYRPLRLGGSRLARLWPGAVRRVSAA